MPLIMVKDGMSFNPFKRVSAAEDKEKYANPMKGLASGYASLASSLLVVAIIRFTP